MATQDHDLPHIVNQDELNKLASVEMAVSAIDTQGLELPSIAKEQIQMAYIATSDLELPQKSTYIATSETELKQRANVEMEVSHTQAQELPKHTNVDMAVNNVATQDLVSPKVVNENIEVPQFTTTDLGLPKVANEIMEVSLVASQDMGLPNEVNKNMEVPIIAPQNMELSNTAHEDHMPQQPQQDMAMRTLEAQVGMPVQSTGAHTPVAHSQVLKKGGRLLSAVLAINIGLVASVLVSSGSLENVSVKDKEVLAFLVILMLLSTLWMIFQFYFSCRKNAVLYKDSHAGPVWLRGGLVFFGICSLVLDVFKIGYYISYIECESTIKLIHPMVQSAFIILQTYFLWVSSKHCVQIHTNISRYGLMLVLITNLSIWMAAVTDESVHQTKDLEEDHHDMFSSGHGSNEYKGLGGVHKSTCQCSNRLCHIFQEGYYYLYPFNIEYSLFASAMTYVMWKNVGREMDDNMPHHSRLSPCFCFKSIFVGLLLGSGVLLGGIVALVIYKVQVNTPEKSPQAHIMFYAFNIVTLSLMSIACLAGSIIYRFDKRDMDGHKNPTRTLDVALLLGAALGQYCISYYSIVAMAATSPGELLNCLNLVYSLLMILQHTVQNTFIIEGLHREPFKDGDPEPEKGLVYSNKAVAPSLTDGVSLETTLPGPDLMVNQTQEERQPWNLKRRMVQELSLFLLLCNIILWLMPAFGARPQLKNNLELKFYGLQIWTIITNICLPFGIFYRMHAAASLLEVFRMS
ncbi:proton channel OTOP2-like [Discoglossus pictus]